MTNYFNIFFYSQILCVYMYLYRAIKLYSSNIYICTVHMQYSDSNNYYDMETPNKMRHYVQPNHIYTYCIYSILINETKKILPTSNLIKYAGQFALYPHVFFLSCVFFFILFLSMRALRKQMC